MRVCASHPMFGTSLRVTAVVGRVAVVDLAHRNMVLETMMMTVRMELAGKMQEVEVIAHMKLAVQMKEVVIVHKELGTDDDIAIVVVNCSPVEY